MADLSTLCARYGSQGEAKLAFTFHPKAIQRDMECKDTERIHMAQDGSTSLDSVNTVMFLRVP
jgi:hypothetical protein